MSRQPINFNGKRVGKWLVVKQVENVQDRPAWLCKCDCGTERVVLGKELNIGRTKSCGCIRKELAAAMCAKRRLPPGEAARNNMLASYKNNCRRRGRSWDLTRDQFLFLTQQNCFYCGAEPRRGWKSKSGTYIHNGIDRRDNDKGYVIDNCLSCCKECNYAKASRTFEDFVNWLLRIGRYTNQFAKSILREGE